MAPEQIAAGTADGAPYGPEVDIFALGNILFCLLGAYGTFDPHCNRSDEQVMSKISAADWSFADFPDQWTAVSDEAKQLITEMLEPLPQKRITADGVLQTRWAKSEGTSDAPLPGSGGQLLRFNKGRKVWRAAIHAATVFAGCPHTAEHATGAGTSSDEPAGGTSGGKADAEGEAESGGKAEGGGGKAGADGKQLPAFAQAELREAFDLFDLDGSGKIDAEEMRQIVRSLGARESDALRILGDADTDGDGQISFDEFTCLVLPLYQNSTAALRHAFDMFDADSSGFIDRGELGVMLRKLGFEWQGTHVFEAADIDGDGKVSFDEFLALYASARPKPAGPKPPDTVRHPGTQVLAPKPNL